MFYGADTEMRMGVKMVYFGSVSNINREVGTGRFLFQRAIGDLSCNAGELLEEYKTQNHPVQWFLSFLASWSGVMKDNFLTDESWG